MCEYKHEALLWSNLICIAGKTCGETRQRVAGYAPGAGQGKRAARRGSHA